MIRSKNRRGIALFVALMVAVCLWLFFRPGERADEHALAVRSAPAVPEGTKTAEADVVTSVAAAGAERTPMAKAQAPAVASEPVVARGCVRGALLDPSNDVIRDSRFAWVRLVDSNGLRTNCDARETGRFEFRGLAFGTYWIIVNADGYRALELSFELRPEQPLMEKDLLLQPVRELLIRVSTPDGKAFFESLQDLPEPPGAMPLVAVATLEAPGERFLGLEGSANNKFGVGHFWGTSPRGRALPPGYWASLYLDCDPPLWVSLVHCQSVLQAQRVAVGQTELEFVLSLEDLLRHRATLRMRILDAASALPIAGARVGLRGADGHGEAMSSDADGNVEIANLAPGRYELRLEAEGHERYCKFIDAAPATITDLGAVSLGADLRLRGRVLDKDGRPRSASFSMGAFDALDSSSRWLPALSFTAAADGSFEIDKLGSRQYVLRTRNLDAISNSAPPGVTTWVCGNTTVDLRNGSIAAFEIRLVPATRLALLAHNGELEGMKFSVLDARGLELISSNFYESRPRHLLLPPGDYAVSLLDACGGLLSKRALVLGSETVELELAK